MTAFHFLYGEYVRNKFQFYLYKYTAKYLTTLVFNVT